MVGAINREAMFGFVLVVATATCMSTIDVVVAWSVPVRSNPRLRLAVSVSSLNTTPDTPPTVGVPPDMEAYAAGYGTVFQEVSFQRCSPRSSEVENQRLPLDLVGTYFRCGPAMFSAGSIVPPRTSIVQPKRPPVPDGQDPDRMVCHPFEGDGAVLGITFDGSNEVSVRFRYVRTAAFTKERKKGERVYRAMDSTRSMGPSAGGGLGNDLPLPLFRHHLQAGLNKYRKNTSNTRAIYWGQRLMTLCEGNQPYKLDARALSTEGRSQLGGAIRRESDSFGAKLSYDATTNHAVFYGVDLGPLSTEVTLYEFNSNFTLIDNGRFAVKLPGLALITDFCSTQNYAVFVQPSTTADPMQFLVGKEPGKSIRATSEPATLHLIPRPGAQEMLQPLSVAIPARNTGPSEANIQFINAYEDGDSTIVVDAILSDGTGAGTGSRPLSWPWGVTLDEYKASASYKTLWRYTVDTKNKTVSRRLLWDEHCSFGVVNQCVSSKRHRYIYLNMGGLAAAVAPPQGIARFDTTTGAVERWMPESYEFCGEPMVAPKTDLGRSGEENVYILSVLWNGRSKESELVVLESNAIAAGPVARIPLGLAVPHGMFGCFTTEVEAIGTAEEIERRAKLADKMESRGNRWNEVKSDFSGLGLRLDDMEEYFGDWNPFN